MTDKIAIDRETLERVLECLVQEGRSLRAAEVREALEQNAEPPAPKDPVAQWQKRHHIGTEGKWENTDEHDAKWWRASSSLWDIRALYAAPQAWRPDIIGDEIEQLRADLVSCRGTVKTELNHYERLAMVHGKTVVAANYEAEAQRLAALLDRIDSLTATPTATKGD